MARATWRALRKAFPDVLSGIDPAHPDDRKDQGDRKETFDPSKMRKAVPTAVPNVPSDTPTVPPANEPAPGPITPPPKPVQAGSTAWPNPDLVPVLPTATGVRDHNDPADDWEDARLGDAAEKAGLFGDSVEDLEQRLETEKG